MTSFELSGVTSVKNKEPRQSVDSNGSYDSKNSSYELSDVGAVKGSTASTQDSAEIRILQEQMLMSQQPQQPQQQEEEKSNENLEEDDNYQFPYSGDTGHASQIEATTTEDKRSNHVHLNKRKFVEVDKDGTGSTGSGGGTLHHSTNSDENIPTQNSQN